ncbi:MAG: hypothetical protein Q9175_000071 [Cornicularia normoerica]
MSLKSDSFPSSTAFDAINSSLQSDDAERKDAVKKGNAVFAFILKNKDGQTDSWYIDLKEKGEVAKGEAPSGKKADDTGSTAIYVGEAEDQRRRYEGRLRITSDLKDPSADGCLVGYKDGTRA